MGAHAGRWVLLLRSGFGLVFCAVSLGLLALAARLWSVDPRVEVILAIGLIALALFAFGVQLSRAPQVAPSQARGGWFTASSLPLLWTVALVVLSIEWIAGRRWTMAELLSAQGEGLTLPWLLLVLPVVLEAQVLAHELGHALVGRAAGMRPLSLRTGLLEVRWDSGGRRLRLNREPGYLLHGRVAFAPMKSLPSLARQLLTVASGVLVNAALAFGALWLLSERGEAIAWGGFWVLTLVAVTGFEMAVTNLLPFQSASLRFESDGLQLLRLLRRARANPGS